MSSSSSKASKPIDATLTHNAHTKKLKKKKSKVKKGSMEIADLDEIDDDEEQESRNLALLETRQLFHQQLEQLQEMISQHQSTIHQLQTQSTSLEKDYLKQQKQMLTALQHQSIDRQLIQSLSIQCSRQ